MGAPRFVQVGATRDGLDPYLAASRRRGMSALLVETPAYLRYREALGGEPFDAVVAVSHLEDADEVVSALTWTGSPPALVLPGFETYTKSAYRVAEVLGTAPVANGPSAFTPL